MRISNTIEDSLPLPLKLHSISHEVVNVSRDHCDLPGFDHYVMEESILRMWGYPLPEDPINEPKQKRQKVESSDISSDNESSVGLMTGKLPSKSKTSALLSSIKSKGLQIIVKMKNDEISEDFLETMTSDSEAYLELWSTVSISDEYDLLAVDCEMCSTKEGGLELTRVTVVDRFSRVVLDTLVKPSHDIIDYHTAFSGLTEEKLMHVNVSLEQVQIAMLRLVRANTILVGHSLENDLRALKLCHRRCVDTGVIYPHPKSYPYRHKLKHLAEDYLKMKIQRGDGHDSVEDASAAMQLFLLKVERGPRFGVRSSLATSRDPLLALLDPKTSRTVKTAYFWTNIDEREMMKNPCCSTGTVHQACPESQDHPLLVDDYCQFLSSMELLTSPSDVCLSYLGIDHSTAAESAAVVIEKVKEALKGTGKGHLLIITSQESSHEYENLNNRKKACLKGTGVAAWTADLEAQLKARLSSYHLGTIHFYAT